MFSKYIYFVFCFSFVLSQEWTYRDQNSWRRSFNSCGGRRQSPVNINTNRLRINANLRLNTNSYEIAHRNVILHNTGHTAELTLNSRNPPMTIGFGRNGDPYVFQNMHFHWGDNNFEGTEHSVDRKFGSAEIHFVHYNQKYGRFSAALGKKDGIVVVTVLLQISRENNRALEPIIRALPQIINFNSSSVIQRFNFGKLLPRNRQLFFQYPGSLTTPPCAETVTFIVFADPIRISPFQVSQFRRLLEESKRGNTERIISNTRNLQQLNGRIIEVSVPQGRSHFSSETNELDYTDYVFNKF